MFACINLREDVLIGFACRCLDGESSVLLLYSLVHGNSDFLEYVLVRTDLDTLVSMYFPDQCGL